MINDIIGSDFYIQLRKLIQEEVQQQLKNSNIESYLDVQIVNYDPITRYCKCIDMSTDEEFNDVINYTNDELTQGNVVRMYYNGIDKYIGRHLIAKEG